MSNQGNVTSIYPVLMTDRVAQTAGFYREHFDFEETFSADWYVSLRHRSRPEFELAVLRFDHPTIPAGFGAPSRGLLINIEVEDAKAARARLVGEAGLPEVQPLREESFGQRHFILRDPSGNLVDVIENIPPSEDYASSYADGAANG